MPSGEKRSGGCTPPEIFVTCFTSAPSRVETKASRQPSGEYCGVFSDLSPAMSSRGALDPSAATAQMSALRRPALASVVVRTNTTVRPSGDNCGSPTRTAVIRSSIASGRFACAPAVAASYATASAAATLCAYLRLTSNMSGPSSSHDRHCLMLPDDRLVAVRHCLRRGGFVVMTYS